MSNVGIFPWSKAISVIWTTRRLLAKGKLCKGMTLFKYYINIRVGIEYFAALEPPNRRETRVFRTGSLPHIDCDN